ncbi:MAG: M23 family metallopeptidase [Reinekea sp.]|nr:M23 family metallopeptidase [Reinekea sp.]
MIAAELPKRGTDDWGNGEFGASRGDRQHNGIDYACYPGTPIYSKVYGSVTKLGYPYGDDLSYRYVQITDNEGLKHRFFYVQPDVKVGDRVTPQTVIGTAQDIAGRYAQPDKVMKNHIHYEIKNGSRFIDPEVFHA